MRVGQKNSLVRQWAPKGSRPRQVKDLRTSSAYLFGAICPERGEGAALVMPRANTEAMDLHLEEISRAVAPNAHAVVLLDQAAWHTTAKLGIPENISLVPLPPKSPELNPAENVWQYLRQNWLSNRVFDSYEAIVEASCQAWNNLTDQPWKIMSIGLRAWGSHKAMLRAVGIRSRAGTRRSRRRARSAAKLGCGRGAGRRRRWSRG